MSIRNLGSLFAPRSVALIGASDRRGAIGTVTLDNLRNGGFAGKLLLVNPAHTQLAGLDVFPNVSALPEVPDLAVVATPPAQVVAIVRDLASLGTKAVVVITAGFAEFGEGGAAMQREMFDAARPGLVRIVGPNCIGVMVPGIGLNASFVRGQPLKGDLAFVSQSGAIVATVLDWAQPRGIGFSKVVSLGDMADVDFGDMLDYLANDSATRAILLYVEGVTHARKFMSAARDAARNKPVLVLKAGRHAEAAKAARSHTGALAGSDVVYDAAFRRAGMLRLDGIAEMFDAVETLALTRNQSGDRLAVLSNGGGPAILATDALLSAGARLAELAPETIAKLDAMLPKTWSRGNPVDIIGDASAERYARSLEVLLADERSDAVLVLDCPTALEDPDEAARAVIETLERARETSPRNVFTVWLGEKSVADARKLFAAARVPTYETPEDAVRGFMHRVRYNRAQELLLEVPPALIEFTPNEAAARAVIERALAAGRRWLDAGEVSAVLDAYGIPGVPSRLASGADEAARAAAELRGPFALKLRSPDITHKSEAGAVSLNLESPERVRAEALVMLERVERLRPDARVDGFLVQQMIDRPGAIELIAGTSVDATFGPVVLFGHGGTAVEAIADTSLELPPLNLKLAREQIARTRVSRLMQGYRDHPPVSVDAVALVLIRIGQIAAAHPEVVELDINPLLADTSGVVALDARIAVAAAPGAPLAIVPYPREYETTASLPDGTKLRLRPLRPEDEPLLADLLAGMTSDDIRFRFGAPLKDLSPQLGARLSQIDYDREIALLAQPLDDTAALGVVRYAADPDGARAEFALAIRHVWQKRGLGRLMLTRLIEIAELRGIGLLFGYVLRENAPMLALCRSLGFSVESDPADAREVILTRPVASRLGAQRLTSSQASSASDPRTASSMPALTGLELLTRPRG